MVSGSEELVSSVLRLENFSNMKCPFPLSVAVPFRACYHLNYREVVVKVVDQEQRISYVTPAATEGIYGGCRVCESKLHCSVNQNHVINIDLHQWMCFVVGTLGLCFLSGYIRSGEGVHSWCIRGLIPFAEGDIHNPKERSVSQNECGLQDMSRLSTWIFHHTGGCPSNGTLTVMG